MDSKYFRHLVLHQYFTCNPVSMGIMYCHRLYIPRYFQEHFEVLFESRLNAHAYKIQLDEVLIIAYKCLKSPFSQCDLEFKMF